MFDAAGRIVLFNQPYLQLYGLVSGAVKLGRRSPTCCVCARQPAHSKATLTTTPPNLSMHWKFRKAIRISPALWETEPKAS